MKEKDYQPRILYPEKHFFKNEGETTTFPNKQAERVAH